MRLSSDLKLLKHELEIFSDETGVSLPDSEPLDGSTYVVKRVVPQPLHCFLYLKPIPPVGPLGFFTREVTIDFESDGIKTVGDLLHQHFPPVEFPFSEPLQVVNDVMELDLSTVLSVIPPDSILMIKYPAPAADAVYNFVFPSKGSETLSVGLGETVADVKVKLVPRFGSANVLPNVFKLRFWGVELRDQDLFAPLGIPSGAEIEVGWNETEDIKVILPDKNERIFVVKKGDRVTSLKGLLSEIISGKVEKC